MAFVGKSLLCGRIGGNRDHEGDGRPLSGGAGEVRPCLQDDQARGSNRDDSVPDGHERRPNPQALHELLQARRGAGPPATRAVADADRAPRADTATGARVRRVREYAAREWLALSRATAGAAAEKQRRPRPALLRVLRVV